MTEHTEAKGDVGSIPVYRSRHTPRSSLPEWYGAFIDWKIGERACLISKSGRPAATVTIKSDTRSHDEAPYIDGARGRGRWVREVLFDGESSLCAISEDQLAFLDSAPSRETPNA